MTPSERDALEAKAERSLRRGELAEALAAFRQLSGAFPTDQALAARLAELQESLQPAELMNPKSNFRSEPPAAATSPFDEAEALASRGDLHGAMTIYRKLMAERPDAELVRERLAELFTLAKARGAPPPAAPQAKPVDSLLSDLLARIGDRKR